MNLSAGIRTVLFVGVLGGCASRLPPVPVAGLPADLQTLRGEWVGEYQDYETGRAGSIRFSLEAGSDTAHGDVVLALPESDLRAGARAREEEANVVESGGVQLAERLRISFVAMAGGRIRGRLDPYPDPECGCMVETVFVGTVAADTLRGTYRSFVESRPGPREGTWHVVRIGWP